jgi:predicted SAM-dependent methyltransferase
MKLHVGCGKRFLPGFVHVDITNHDHIDYECDIRKLNSIFENNSVDECYACHVFEHIRRHEIDSCLTNICDILKPGGTLRLAVPDIEKAIKLYTSGVPLYPTLYGQFWGGQKNEYDYHTIGFDFKTLEMFLTKNGFENVQRYDWRSFLPNGFDDYSRSYIPHMDTNGELLSLNVVATKRFPS